MSFNMLTPTVVGLVTGGIAIYLVQILFSNRSGSEKTIASILLGVSGDAWSFVALQYCYGISNRTYMVFVTSKMLCGAKVRGLLAAPVIVSERWKDPLFYPRPEVVAKYADIPFDSDQFKQMNSANFQIRSEDVDSIEYSADPKWGMGTVPYSGRLFIRKKDGKKVELILLGNQIGSDIRDRLVACGYGVTGK
jgi:hypothetical protein